MATNAIKFVPSKTKNSNFSERNANEQIRNLVDKKKNDIAVLNGETQKQESETNHVTIGSLIEENNKQKKSTLKYDPIAFANLSSQTKDSYFNKKMHPLVLKEATKVLKNKKEIEHALQEAQIRSKDIENYKVTDAGNILIYCSSKEAYNKLLNTSIGGIKTTESLRANDYKSIIIKDISYEDAKEASQEMLNKAGIIQIEQIDSNIKDKKINIIKAVCKDTSVAKKLISEGLKLNYKRHKVEEFIFKPKLIVCFNCGDFNHTAKSQRCKKKTICINCCSEDHSSSECPNRDDRNKLKCPNCQLNHPATYAGCQVFKAALSAIYASKNNNLAGANERSTQAKFPVVVKTQTESSHSSSLLAEIKSEFRNLNAKFDQVHSLIENEKNKRENETKEIKMSIEKNEYMIKNSVNKLVTTMIKSFKIISNKENLNEIELEASLKETVLANFDYDEQNERFITKIDEEINLDDSSLNLSEDE